MTDTLDPRWAAQQQQAQEDIAKYNAARQLWQNAMTPSRQYVQGYEAQRKPATSTQERTGFNLIPLSWPSETTTYTPGKGVKYVAPSLQTPKGQKYAQEWHMGQEQKKIAQQGAKWQTPETTMYNRENQPEYVSPGEFQAPRFNPQDIHYDLRRQALQAFTYPYTNPQQQIPYQDPNIEAQYGAATTPQSSLAQALVSSALTNAAMGVQRNPMLQQLNQEQLRKLGTAGYGQGIRR